MPGTPDFRAFDDLRKKKQAFFDFLVPYVRKRNRELAAVRHRIESVRDAARGGKPLAGNDDRFLRSLAARYRVEISIADGVRFYHELLAKVDALPPSLVLAQAATESAWGTSRFARHGNSYFGEWCFSRGCGIVPANRLPSARHEVERFETVAQALASYYTNLNRNGAYREMRAIRAEQRARGLPLSGCRLSEGLARYSSRPGVYIETMKALIRVNRLYRYDLGPDEPLPPECRASPMAEPPDTESGGSSIMAEDPDQQTPPRSVPGSEGTETPSRIGDAS